MVCFELHNKKANHKTKGRYMQEYTPLQDSAHAQTVDIPAFGGKLDVSWNPESQVTQWGGLAYFVSYLKTSGLFDRLVEDAPFHYTSPNAPDVRDVVGTTGGYSSTMRSRRNVTKNETLIRIAPRTYAPAMTANPISKPDTPYFCESVPITTPESPPNKNAKTVKIPTEVERCCGGMTSKSDVCVLTSKNPRKTP